jgi:2-oxopent-4-enoate/cis-2-oxohex-4-enoate hydratase
MRIEEAINILWQAMQTGDHAPTALRKTLTLAEAYRVQLGILKRWITAGETHAGWKIGGTSEAARKMLGLQAPLSGYLLASRRFSTGQTFAHEQIGKPVIESELCVTIERRLTGPGVTREQVLDAVSAVAPAFEVVQMRGDLAGDLPLGVADDVAQWGYVTGTPLSPYPRNLDLGAITVEMRKNGEVIQQVRGREAIEDQLQSIAWLANQLAEYDMALELGQCIMTGSFTKPLPIAKGDRWETQFSSVGTVSATFV